MSNHTHRYAFECVKPGTSLREDLLWAILFFPRLYTFWACLRVRPAVSMKPGHHWPSAHMHVVEGLGLPKTPARSSLHEQWGQSSEREHPRIVVFPAS